MSGIPQHDDPAEDLRASLILAQRTRALAAPARGVATPMAGRDAKRILVCGVGSECYGIDMASAAAVIPAGPLTKLTAAPPGLLGLYGRAGHIYNVVDLATTLGLSEGDPTSGHLIMLRREPRLIALRVDRVLGVATVEPLADTAHAVTGSDSGPVTGRAILPPGTILSGETLVNLINLDRLLQAFLPPSGHGY